MTEKHLLDPDRTPEEVRANVNRILALNSRPIQICICCLEQITNNQTLVSTIHGPYHGAPKNCVEGREGED